MTKVIVVASGKRLSPELIRLLREKDVKVLHVSKEGTDTVTLPADLVTAGKIDLIYDYSPPVAKSPRRTAPWGKRKRFQNKWKK